MNSRIRLTAFAAAFTLLASALYAEVPQIINYQGRVVVGTTNFNGTGQFKFALINAGGGGFNWSNDGTGGGGEPTNAVALPVTNGLYSVLLGDTTLPNMTAIPTTAFNNPDVRLRVWFNDGVNGSQQLFPDQRIAAVGYAMTAAGVQLPATLNANTGLISQSNARLLHTFGTNNFFAGSEAGNFTMTGTTNIGVGFQALVSNTTGSNNTALGFSALHSNTEGIRNTVSGYLALGANTTGGFNTAMGNMALSNTTGSRNIGIGSSGGQSLTTGDDNIAIGTFGVAGESGKIRIGATGTHTDTFLAGVIHGNGSGLTALPASSITGTIVGAQLGSNLTLGGTTTGSFSGPLAGNVSGSAGSFTGSLAGDVTGTQVATVVGAVGGVTALNVASGATLANAATNANSAGTIVKRDASGNFAAGGIAANEISLPPTTNASAGVVSQDGEQLLHTAGLFNFFAGARAGNFTLSGNSNTVIGYDALSAITAGSANTATGAYALRKDTTGGGNTAMGYGALSLNLAGSSNTAVGSNALAVNSDGSFNTGVGVDAGGNISAGNYNIVLGSAAGDMITTGSSNIAIGYRAGNAISTGSNNIDIGNAGFGNESNAIRIGTVGSHNKAVMAGIFGVTVGGSAPVIVNASGLLGTVVSSRRFKTDIADMDAASEALLRLRPVTFHYKPELDDTGLLQFGLIAEEVAEVNPDLVLRDGRGEINTVRYEAVNAMLLNEFLKERQRSADADAALREENTSLKQRVAELEAGGREREARLIKLEQLLAPAPRTAVNR